MTTTNPSHRMKAVASEMLVEAFETRNQLSTLLLKAALSGPTRKIARQALYVDAMVRQHEGQQAAARWLMDFWNVPVSAYGVENTPSDGPLLIVSNHAGWGDAIALWAALPRSDIYTVVKTNGLLRAMPNLVNHMIAVKENKEIAAVRQIIHCLRDGHTVLLFPRGEIEPDPCLNQQGAINSLQQWTTTVEMIARYVPDLRVVPAAVGGVLSYKAQNHPIARLYKNQGTREYVGATLQLIFGIFDDVRIDIHIGEAIPAKEVNLAQIQLTMTDLLTSCVNR